MIPLKKIVPTIFIAVQIFIPAKGLTASRAVGLITSIEGDVSFVSDKERSADFGVDIYEGDILKTGRNSTLIIAYNDSCRQEQIGENSIVKVGSKQSVIKKGNPVKSELFDCEAPKVLLNNEDSHAKGGMIFRGKMTE